MPVTQADEYPFYGDLRKRREFREELDWFIECNRNLAAGDKFSHMRIFLNEDAATPIAGLSTTESCYMDTLYADSSIEDSAQQATKLERVLKLLGTELESIEKSDFCAHRISDAAAHPKNSEESWLSQCHFTVVGVSLPNI
ncbi:hypothetical protein HPB50_024238 [Hyalomma asiaticum]|uniref:Uncharacterized protein n=1 Tax=Hyalomma asiaticum TaxID=266040 RepID=A0ACB7SSN5_HYAAI|nr:hypothetical protein HPB50_024238 [Hyalomma asiaticum]